MSILRRDFLQGMGSVAIATVPGFSIAQSSKLSVGVIGGGIVGASVALQLAQSGASVTVFEKTAPASGATSKSFAWLNAGSSNSHYRDLRMQSLSAYHELDKQLQSDITWGGYLNWESEPGAAAEMRAAALEYDRAGYSMKTLSAEDFATIAPNLTPGSFETAVYAGMDGHLDPVGEPEALLPGPTSTLHASVANARTGILAKNSAASGVREMTLGYSSSAFGGW